MNKLALSAFIICILFSTLTMANDNSVKQNKWSNISNSGTYTLTIYPKDLTYSIGEYHEWIIEVHDKSKNAVPDLRIGLSGGMAGHGHGLPTQPVVSKSICKGRYLIEGMLFSMSGSWTLFFDIRNAGASERVRFDIELTH